MRSLFIYSTNKVSKILKYPEIVERCSEFDKLEGTYLHYPNFYTMNFHATGDLECRVSTQFPQSRMVKGILATQQHFFQRMAQVSQPPQLKQFTSPFTVIVNQQSVETKHQVRQVSTLGLFLQDLLVLWARKAAQNHSSGFLAQFCERKLHGHYESK